MVHLDPIKEVFIGIFNLQDAICFWVHALMTFEFFCCDLLAKKKQEEFHVGSKRGSYVRTSNEF